MGNMKDFTKKAFIIGGVAVIVILLVIAILVGVIYTVESNRVARNNAENFNIYDSYIYEGKHGKNLKVLKIMVSKLKRDVNAEDDYNRRGVHQAAVNNNIKALDYLIKNKADINVLNDDGATPLIYAIGNTNAKMVELLLKNGADVSLYEGEYEHPLNLALYEKNNDVIKLILAKVTNINNITPNPLLSAIQAGDINILKDILTYSTNVNLEIKNADNISTLYIAVSAINSEMVNFLIEKEVSVKNAGEGEYIGTILNAAIPFEYYPFDEDYISAEDYKYTNKQNESAQIIDTLLKNGGLELINKKSGKYSLTPIFLSSVLGYANVTDNLIKNKANVNIKDSYGNTPLIYAILTYFNMKDNDDDQNKFYTLDTIYGRTVIKSKEDLLNNIKLLLDSKADLNIEVGDSTPFDYSPSGFSPIAIAVYKNDLDLTKLLIKYKPNLTVLTEEGDTLLESAMSENNIDMVQVLVENGFDLNTAGLSSNTPLMIASFENLENIVKIFLSKNANVNAKNRNGDTALHFASENDNKEIIKLLVAKNADVNAKNRNGDTALHFAVSSGNIETVNELIIAASDVNIENNSGNTVFDLAEMKQNKDVIIEVLKKSPSFKN